MKNLLLGILILVSVSLNAQCVKGNWLVGGSAGFSSSTVDIDGAEAVTNIHVSPDIGYFIIDRLAVGAAIDFTSTSSNGHSGSSFSVGPAVRYYFADLGESAKLFGQAQFTFGSETPFGEDDSVSSTAWGVSAGLAWFLNHHVALEASLGYGSHKPGDENGIAGIATNTFGLEVGFQIELGE